MFKRKIAEQDVINIIKNGEIIKSYPDDKPYPSELILGYVGSRPLHVVVSINIEGCCFVITTYEPDVSIWNEKFSAKK
ncbi:MAG: DUF4258 domain-containing protein [Prolixibacteraceae bacterium]|nr:DUF4258 domain-containing protein [Prolixibacteraceae bacterium]